ncbi:MAG: DUF4168 domain-containing protein [Brumimicrobium sp.]|nr:DUF4168 domain-containing protein [Brumimicrobium sp.]
MYFKPTLSIVFLTLFGINGNLFSQSVDENEAVNNKDLEKFVVIYKQIQEKNLLIQKEMILSVEEEGMEVERYTEIQKAKANPATEIKITTEEENMLGSINEKLTEIRNDFEQEVEALIKEEGMTLEDYRMIYLELEKDRDLQEKFRELMKS